MPIPSNAGCSTEGPGQDQRGKWEKYSFGAALSKIATTEAGPAHSSGPSLLDKRQGIGSVGSGSSIKEEPS